MRRRHAEIEDFQLGVAAHLAELTEEDFDCTSL
jgi:hypothetical protein